ncbi:GNAT family N-acetyltransferase [Bifidobacterium sp. ESL0763]|uniref:GNAT family N-acetyltransferase n=1 Tax=Bifidobacterium sp. ESL0763 TaxID=2983227 RepID=UPI0023F62CE9|nr:GNAT family N-acetyltransferase [Bifidobacterium sp. ESL0763]MDF7663432.1 GNAT family N-acetyltransferase [Bifidobacterium sp. ESL0763]
MEIITPRLTLRHWKRNDPDEAASLFEYARDPDIGPRCGWTPHRDAAESMDTLNHVFTGDENYAITLRGAGCGKDDGDNATSGEDEHVGGNDGDSDSAGDDNRTGNGTETSGAGDEMTAATPGKPIGAIELKKTGPDDHVGAFVREAIDGHRLFEGMDTDELERALAHYDGDRVLGYWIGRPFWGHGLMSEALEAMIRHAFADLGANAVWGGHYVENPASGKVMEHCGMRAVCRKDGDYFPLIGERHDAIIRVVTREQWERREQRG